MFEILRCDANGVSFACWPPVKCSKCEAMHGLLHYELGPQGSAVTCWQCSEGGDDGS